MFGASFQIRNTLRLLASREELLETATTATRWEFSSIMESFLLSVHLRCGFWGKSVPDPQLATATRIRSFRVFSRLQCFSASFGTDTDGSN